MQLRGSFHSVANSTDAAPRQQLCLKIVWGEERRQRQDVGPEGVEQLLGDVHAAFVTHDWVTHCRVQGMQRTSALLGVRVVLRSVG